MTHFLTSFLDFQPVMMQFCIILSCLIAVGVNLSQFICIGRFTAVSFQVLGHMKTVLVLVLGFTLFGRDGLNSHVSFFQFKLFFTWSFISFCLPPSTSLFF